LIDKGQDVPEIAARFAVPDSTVRKRLALARVSPRIFALYRDGTIPWASPFRATKIFQRNGSRELRKLSSPESCGMQIFVQTSAKPMAINVR
jgi:hypothetical protein